MKFGANRLLGASKRDPDGPPAKDNRRNQHMIRVTSSKEVPKREECGRDLLLRGRIALLPPGDNAVPRGVFGARSIAVTLLAEFDLLA